MTTVSAYLFSDSGAGTGGDEAFAGFDQDVSVSLDFFGVVVAEARASLIFPNVVAFAGGGAKWTTEAVGAVAAANIVSDSCVGTGSKFLAGYRSHRLLSVFTATRRFDLATVGSSICF